MTTENSAQELDSLALKKKARRRLVGTIALVLLSLIILPNLLVNKSQPMQQESPVVLMPENTQLESVEPDLNHFAEAPVSEALDVEASARQLALDNAEEVVIAAPQSTKPVVDAVEPKVESVEVKEQAVKQAQVQNEPTVKEKEIKVEPKVVEKPAEMAKKAVVAKKTVEQKAAEKKLKAAEPKVSQPLPKKTAVITTKTHNGYAVQVGVFADTKNVERMKAKIALAGFESITTNLVRDGKRLTRLRVGYFISRKGAENALNKLKENNLPGAVVIR